MPENFIQVRCLDQHVFIVCTPPPSPKQGRYLTFRNLFNRGKLCSYHPCMDNSCCFLKDGVVNLVKSASILQIFLINENLAKTPLAVKECHALLTRLSWKLKWAFPIACCLSSVCSSVNFSHFQLPLQNHWANFNQTWHNASLDGRNSSLFKWRATPFSKGR